MEVFGGILSAIGIAATQSDALLSKEEVVTYYPTQEIMRYTNEIGRMTNQPAPSFMAGKKVIAVFRQIVKISLKVMPRRFPIIRIL